jgi:hypothetical protein
MNTRFSQKLWSMCDDGVVFLDRRRIAGGKKRPVGDRRNLYPINQLNNFCGPEYRHRHHTNGFTQPPGSTNSSGAIICPAISSFLIAHTLVIKFVEQLEDGPCQFQILGRPLLISFATVYTTFNLNAHSRIQVSSTVTAPYQYQLPTKSTDKRRNSLDKIVNFFRASGMCSKVKFYWC